MHTFEIYLALSILLITLLGLNISRLRIKNKIANGDGGNKSLKIAIRTHINSLEHIIPYSLLLFAIKPFNISPVCYLVLSYGFLIVRLSHTYSMLNSSFKLRQMTAALTYTFEVIACLTLLYLAL